VWAPIAAMTFRKSCAMPSVRRPSDSSPRAAAISRSRAAIRACASSRPRRSAAASPESIVMSRVQWHVRHERQHDTEERARARVVADVDGAAVILDDLLREGEAEPRAAFFRGKERVEDAVEIGRRNAGTRILDLDGHAPRAGARGREGLGLAPTDMQRER